MYPHVREDVIETALLPRARDLIIDTYLSVRRKLNPMCYNNVFELFGFDFMVDEDMRVWLLEVNTNPHLGQPSEYMRKLLPQMINDMLKIVVDPILKPQKVPDPDRENAFELIYRDASKRHGNAVNKRRPFTKDTLYPIPSIRVASNSPPRGNALNGNNKVGTVTSMAAQ